MEDLKDRYFRGVRKILAGRTPESLMTTSQLEQYNSYKWDKSTPRLHSQDDLTPFIREGNRTKRVCGESV